MLDALITNKTRVKLLLRFFLNPESSSYLRGLEEEFGESTNAIRIELNRFESAGLLVSWVEKNRKMFTANRDHPLFPDIRSLLRKHTGIDTIIEKVINNLGNIESAYLNNMTAGTPDLKTLDLYIFGDPIDQDYLASLTRKATALIRRDIRCTVLPAREEKAFQREHRTAMLVWKR